jgi:transcriptional regulator with XRE-family HTH domain
LRKTIKEWMLEKSISKEKLAVATGVTTQTVYNWLKKPGKITFEKGERIADALGVEFADIIFLK